MTIRFKAAVRTVLAVTALTMACAASAAVHQWSFSNASFTDGASAEGSFLFDGTNFFGWSITTFRSPDAPGFPEVVGYHYSEDTATLDFADGLRLLRNDGGPGNFLHITFSSLLGEGGTVIGSALERTLSPGGSDNGHSSDAFTLVGTLLPLTSPVPEPETLAMGLLGLGLVGAAARRRAGAGTLR